MTGGNKLLLSIVKLFINNKQIIKCTEKEKTLKIIPYKFTFNTQNVYTCQHIRYINNSIVCKRSEVSQLNTRKG